MGGKGSGRKRTAQCGTHSGWARHKRLKEPVCEACRLARNEYMKLYKTGVRKPKIRLNDAERRRRGAQYRKQRRADQKAIINAWKLQQGSCADCGWIITPANLVAIDCDHTNPAEKQYNLSEAAGCIPDHKLELELAKCVARCRNCHAIRTEKEGHYYVNRQRPTADGTLEEGEATSTRAPTQLSLVWEAPSD